MFNRVRFALILFMLAPTLMFAEDDQELFRAIHMGGNWGRNTFSVLDPPQEYFDYLNSINVNWVGISVALHIEDSMDSTVERKYSGVGIPTFTDENLVRTIRELKKNDFNIYLTLAFEAMEAEQAEHPVKRWQLGDPKIPNEDPNVLPEFWPWALEHPEHEQFIRKFWETYTEQAVHFAELCEAEDVGLYSLGTETNRLFRTRTGGYWPNNYLNHLTAMVDSVRQIYSGPLTYDMAYRALTDAEFFLLDDLWEDMDLDVIGISAYFPLANTMPDTVMRVEQLTSSWNRIFDDYLTPLQNKNPNKPILFLEFGYVDAIGSPHMPSIREFETKVFEDADLNGLDDGEETQANVYSAFFNVNENNSNLIKGAFLWGNQMSNNIDWANSFDKLRTFSIRNKIAEDVVRQYYAQYTPSPDIPELVSPADSLSGSPTTLSLIWNSSINSTSYRVQVVTDSVFSSILIDKIHSDTTLLISDLEYNTLYFWRVRSLHQSVESDWSRIYNFTTAPFTSIADIPDEFKLDQNYPNPFNPRTAVSYELSPLRPFYVKTSKSYAGQVATCMVNLSIYDINGKKIATLVNDIKSAGYHTVNWDASDYNSGIYFYRLQAGEFVDTKKMILLK